MFRDHEFSADQRSRAVKRIAEVRGLRAHQFPEDQGPLAHPVRPRRYREINNFYTSTVYEKGSEVVRMIRTLLGADDFRAGMDLYFERHDGQAVTIEDFVKVFEDVSDRDLSQFSLWYHQAGTPHVAVNASYDAAAGECVLDIEQSIPPTPSESRKRLMHIPLAFGLVGPNGKDLDYESVDGATVEDGVINLRKRRHSVRFSGVAARPVVSINRGFSAPITLSMEVQSADRLFLARHDSDPFCRWQALNTLYSDALIAASKTARGGKEPAFLADLIAHPAEIAADETLEHAFRALAIALPAEADIAREIGKNVDPDAIHAARRALQTEIGKTGKVVFERLYAELEDSSSFSPDATSAGRRALRNGLLDYICAEAGAPSVALAQFHAASNMTDRAAALMLLAHMFPGSDEADGALKSFEKRYRDNPLVLDKWFQIQATVPGSETAGKVRALMAHPAFSLTNPNRVRALVGTFAAANQTGFHGADGEGYRLVAETLLALDKQNPQVAARIATAFRSWKSLEPERREHARKALLGMSRTPGLSTDLSDIVERTLA